MPCLHQETKTRESGRSVPFKARVVRMLLGASDRGGAQALLLEAEERARRAAKDALASRAAAGGQGKRTCGARLRTPGLFACGALAVGMVHWGVADRSMHGPDVFIATYHKTGTVLSRKLFTDLSHHTLVPFAAPAADASTCHALGACAVTGAGVSGLPLRTWLSAVQSAHFFQHDHAHLFDWASLTSPRARERGRRREYRVVHLVRDPRSIIVSSYLYNRNTSESWASERKLRLGNVSYGSLLRRLPSSQGVLVEASRLLYGRNWLPGEPPLPQACPPVGANASAAADADAATQCIVVGKLRCGAPPIAFAGCTCGCIAPLAGMLRVLHGMQARPWRPRATVESDAV